MPSKGAKKHEEFMKYVSKSLLYSLVIFVGTPLLRAERTAGAELVEDAGDVASILYDLAAEPLEKREIERFLTATGPVLEWADENVNLWLEADASDRPLDVIRSFAIWKSVELSGSEFVATLAKLMFLREYLQEPELLKGLKGEIKQMEAVVAENRLSPFVLEMARKEIAEKQRLVDLLEGNVPRNVKLYKAEQERIDFDLDRFEGIGR